MASGINKTRIIFFIGSLRSGGKERRLVELLSYLQAQGQYELLVVLTKSEIHYQEFYRLNIPYKFLYKKWKRNDLSVFLQFYSVCSQFRPHIIHTWGRIQSLYTLPTAVWKRIPIVNSQITGAPAKLSRLSLLRTIDNLTFYFSKVILANSNAGLETYDPPKSRRKVIYNGINLNRFQNLPCVAQIKEKYTITTPYVVVMVASFTDNKDYNLFFKVAKQVTAIRDDVTFIGVGGYDTDDSEYKRILSLSAQNSRILFPGKINDVESLVNVCDVGVLFSPNGEGISNAILEYMALAKPVIATGTGGTIELIKHNQNGYLVANNASAGEVSDLLVNLIDDKDKRAAFGEANQKIIYDNFSLDKMGKAFEQVYQEVLV